MRDTLLRLTLHANSRSATETGNCVPLNLPLAPGPSSRHFSPQDWNAATFCFSSRLSRRGLPHFPIAFFPPLLRRRLGLAVVVSRLSIMRGAGEAQLL